MTSAGKLLKICFFLGLLITFTSSPISAGTKPQLCILSFPEMHSLAQLDPSTDGTFSLSFLHSVSLNTVTDVYRIEANEIIQISETFSQHGAGLPSQSDDIGVTGWVHSNGMFTVELDRKVSPLVIRVQSGYQNKLTQNGREYRMSDWAIGALLLTPCGTINRMKDIKNG
ncbi:DUF1850 domain-containing protein [Kiloniella antarctica]|uniref:DUF1850 domain-containing protein n=1 Tax=Kiloniella antarctica TaxID=1550907 RepID=A0ABW5BQ20_9PROT